MAVVNAIENIASPITVEGVVNSIEAAESINGRVADRIVNDISNSVSLSEVAQIAERISQAEGGVDQAVLEEIVVEDIVSDSIQNVVGESVAAGDISAEDGREIVASFAQVPPEEERRDEERERRDVPRDRVKYIEDLLVEIQKPRREIKNIREIEIKVFKCLGLIN
jgi:polyhydroxyalkanoate synthesis regulator phasin